MTTEPKFVPKEAVSVKLGEDVEVKIRLVDCVGYMVEEHPATLKMAQNGR